MFEIIRCGGVPGCAPQGVGGDANTLWHCDNCDNKIYELSTTDFSVVREAVAAGPRGIGGDVNTIWHVRFDDIISELSTTDFSVVRSANAPSTDAWGIGGDANTIWHCDYAADKIYELSTIDFSVVRSANSPTGRPAGIGGDANTIWHTDIDTGRIYELSTTDFSVVRSALIEGYPPWGRYPWGIGGDANVIWAEEDSTDEILELTTKTCGEVELGDKVFLLPIGNFYGDIVALKSFIFREGYNQNGFLSSLDEKVALKLAFRSCRGKVNDKVICLPIEGMKENIVALR